MNGRFLVLEYEKTAINAYINKNDYHSGLVEKWMSETDPEEDVKELVRTVRSLEGKVTEAEDEIKTMLNHDYESTLKDKELAEIVKRLKFRVAYLEEVLHAQGKPCGSVGGIYKNKETIDLRHVTCRKCLVKIKQAEKSGEDIIPSNLVSEYSIQPKSGKVECNGIVDREPVDEVLDKGTEAPWRSDNKRDFNHIGKAMQVPKQFQEAASKDI